MSHQLINHSPDLKRLRDDGFEICVEDGFLVVTSVPYVNDSKEIKYGSLVSELTLAGDQTAKPSTHVIHFVGSHPCHKDGTEIQQITHGRTRQVLSNGIAVDLSFSNKPKAGYLTYFEKISTYAEIISAPAVSLDPSVTPRTFQVLEDADKDSPFHYIDTNSSRAKIGVNSSKLMGQKVAIIGVGGTGSYILDSVAKTPVAEIHLFDADYFLQHNAFRSPGAPSIESLRKRSLKVEHFAQIYSEMHRNIVPHGNMIDSSNIDMLAGIDFVFICMDNGEAKQPIVSALEQAGCSFIDVGIGIHQVESELLGIVRTTTSTEANRACFRENVSFAPPGDDAYLTNIQIADLNMLNAAFAVLKWKKIYGFYQDLVGEHHCTYTLNCGMLLDDKQAHP